MQTFLCNVKAPKILLFIKRFHVKLKWLIWGYKNMLATEFGILTRLLRMHVYWSPF